MKEELCDEQQQIAKRLSTKLTSSLNTQMTLLKRQLAISMQCLDNISAYTTIDGNMDQSN